jgi:hypothetical protein
MQSNLRSTALEKGARLAIHSLFLGLGKVSNARQKVGEELSKLWLRGSFALY